MNEEFVGFLEGIIETHARKHIDFSMLANSHDVASEWQKLDTAFELKSNENFYFLGSLYQLLASILDLAMRWQDMIKQEERSEEWKVRN